MWGEDPQTAPDFGYEQERRAPKMPDAGNHLHRLGAEAHASLVDATLICEVEIYSRHGRSPTFYRYKLGTPPATRPRCGGDWDTLNAPDALIRLRLRDEYPISLFGPEDHWGFFVSIPRVSLRAGDELALKLWDRDSNDVYSDAEDVHDAEFMGAAELTWDGRLPIWLHGPFFAAKCNAMSPEQALAAAKPKLSSLEKQLHQAEMWRPNPDVWGFGRNTAVQSLTSNFEILTNATFRYPAGFLGWDHPEIQKRLARRRAVLQEEPLLRRNLVADLQKKAARWKGENALDTPRGKVRFGEVSCEGGDCVVPVVASAPMIRDLCGSAVEKPHLSLAGIDPDGTFTAARIELVVPADGGAPEIVPCTSASPERPEVHLRATVPAAASVLWLGGLGAAHMLALPGKPSP
ncbi:Hypothetical protein A7982_10348 [Minicystis rosea]|nr:Hypothetical protein A7982_10348 [Minicystis rosea]